MPTNADKPLPPITAQGWAMGLDGNTNISSALAPRDAMTHSLTPTSSPSIRAKATVQNNPIRAPIAALIRSGHAT